LPERSKRVLVARKPVEREVRELASKLEKVYSSSKVDKMKLRLLASEVLRLVKHALSYRDLYELTGLPEPILCRYVKGSIIPSFDHAVEILARTVLSIDLGYLLKYLAEREKCPAIDLLRVLKDPYIVRLLSIMIMLYVVDKQVTKVVAASESVLPIATILSMELGVPVVLVKRKSYPGIQYLSITVMRSPRDVEVLYMDKDLITRKDRVLVLIDVVYTGKTLEAVLYMLMKSKVEVVDAVAMIGLGAAWEERLQPFKVKVLSTLPA